MKKMTEAIKTLIAAAVGLGIVLVVLLSRHFFAAVTMRERLRDLCDGCTMAGAVLLTAGMVCLLSSSGGLDLFLYAMRSVKLIFTPIRRVKRESFAEYAERRRETEKPRTGFLLWTGAAYLALAVLLLLFY